MQINGFNPVQQSQPARRERLQNWAQNHPQAAQHLRQDGVQISGRARHFAQNHPQAARHLVQNPGAVRFFHQHPQAAQWARQHPQAARHIMQNPGLIRERIQNR